MEPRLFAFACETIVCEISVTFSLRAPTYGVIRLGGGSYPCPLNLFDTLASPSYSWRE